jgi:F-type H+-transporting ATPase subunit epsilon
MEVTMANTFSLEILASDHPFFKGDCEMLVFPGIDGEFGILPNHEDMVTCVIAGEVRFKVNEEWIYAAVSTGFIEIAKNKVVLLADTVEKPEDIDVHRAEEAKMRALERMRQEQSIKEYYNTQAALSRAMNRLKVKQRHQI